MKFKAKIDHLNSKEGPLKAYASIVIDDALAIDGIRLLEAKNKHLFLSFPSRKYTDRNGDGKYKDVCYPLSAEVREEMTKAVVEAYKEELSVTQDEDNEESEQDEEDETEGQVLCNM